MKITDTERIDWLTESDGLNSYLIWAARASYGRDWGLKKTSDGMTAGMRWFKTLREAIDAGIKRHRKAKAKESRR